jgi:transcriptional regulator with XRE-family HTH domain
MPAQPAQQLGAFLRTLRIARQLTLRQVEHTAEISNAYLSQIEQGKIAQPSPHILQKLATCYSIAPEELMLKAGYITEPARSRSALAPAAAGKRRGGAVRGPIKGHVATSSTLGTVTPEEEDELLKYLAFLRSKNR